MAKKLDLTDLASFDPTPVAQAGAQAGTPLEVPIDDVIPDPKQPRKKFDPVKLQKLADVIKASRLNQPVTVRPKNADGKYVIGLGERRWRACKIAGLTTLRIQISDEIDYYDQVTENTEQEPLTTMEQARFIAWRVSEGDKKSLIAKRLGMRPDTVSQLLALANAPDFIQQLGDGTEVGGRTLYELVQAHKEFPEDVERYAQGNEITRAGLSRLVEQLRSRKVEGKEQPNGQGKTNAQGEQNEASDPALEHSNPSSDTGQERPLERSNAGPSQPERLTSTEQLDDQGKEQSPAQPLSSAKATPPAAPLKREIRVVIDGRPAVLANAAEVMVIFTDTGEQQTVQLSAIETIEVTTNEST